MNDVADGLGCLTALIITASIAVCVVVCAQARTDERNDGRTREQLVERGLAEYVIVDAQTGTTEWRWKE